MRYSAATLTALTSAIQLHLVRTAARRHFWRGEDGAKSRLLSEDSLGQTRLSGPRARNAVLGRLMLTTALNLGSLAASR